MKTSEIANKYRISQKSFEDYLIERDLKFSEGRFNNKIVNDSLVDEYVNAYLENYKTIEAERQKKQKELSEIEKQKAEEKKKIEAEIIKKSRKKMRKKDWLCQKCLFPQAFHLKATTLLSILAIFRVMMLAKYQEVEFLGVTMEKI